MKDTYDGLSDLLKRVAVDVAAAIPGSFDIDVNVIYFPQLGFNIAIPLNDRGEPVFNGSDNDWELIFITENGAYFKDYRMRELDETLGDIYGLICGKTRQSLASHKNLTFCFRKRDRDCVRASTARPSI